MPWMRGTDRATGQDLDGIRVCLIRCYGTVDGAGFRITREHGPRT
jgi:hypothetical protein